MNAVRKIEDAVSKLSPDELVLCRRWFQQIDASTWEAQFATDVKAGPA